MSENKMAGQHHRCNEQKLGQTLGDGEGQGGLVCCSPWGRKESDATEQLNNNNNVWDINIMPLLKSAQLCFFMLMVLPFLSEGKTDLGHLSFEMTAPNHLQIWA